MELLANEHTHTQRCLIFQIKTHEKERVNILFFSFTIIERKFEIVGLLSCLSLSGHQVGGGCVYCLIIDTINKKMQQYIVGAKNSIQISFYGGEIKNKSEGKQQKKIFL